MFSSSLSTLSHLSDFGVTKKRVMQHHPPLNQSISRTSVRPSGNGPTKKHHHVALVFDQIIQHVTADVFNDVPLDLVGRQPFQHGLLVGKITCRQQQNAAWSSKKGSQQTPSKNALRSLSSSYPHTSEEFRCGSRLIWVDHPRSLHLPTRPTKTRNFFFFSFITFIYIFIFLYFCIFQIFLYFNVF